MAKKSPATYKEFDVHVGLSYAGSEEQYVKFLRRYFSMIQGKAKRIKQCCEREDIEEYTLEVHALKSNSRLIGAIALADEAEYLEQCGVSGNIEEIKKKTPQMLKSYKAVKELFSFILTEEEQGKGDIKITAEETKALYKEIIGALEDFDIDTAAELLDSLMNYDISGVQSEYIFRAKKKVVDFAYDKAIEIMKNALSALESERKTKKKNAKLTHKILIVDDNDMNRTLAEELLSDIGAETMSASSGEECLKLLKKNEFDIILLDQMMPKMDGIETLKNIKEKKLAEGTPVIVLTADSARGSKDKYLKAGFDDYIPKPLYLDSVCTIIEKYKKRTGD